MYIPIATLRSGRCLAWLVAGLLTLSGGCDALNPAFVDAVAPEFSDDFATVQNAPGHVVIAFVNSAEVDEQLLAWLETNGGVVLTDAQKRSLRPRLRFQVQVTFTTGTTDTIEFVSGSDELVQSEFAATSANDLDQFPRNNNVVLCDVAGVVVLTDTIEVFIPAQLEEHQQVLTTGPGGTQNTEFILRQQIPPGFRALVIDQPAPVGGQFVQANIGVRDVPVPVTNPLCGSVVAITVSGQLSVPFNVTDSPSYDVDDAAAVASIGGRYTFDVSIQ